METKPTPRKYDPHTKTTEHTCVICGQKFKSNYSLTKYCSKECSKEAARRKREKIIIPTKQPTTEQVDPIQTTSTQPIQITIQPQEANKPTAQEHTPIFKEKPSERQIIDVIPDDWKFPTPRPYNPHKRLFKRTCSVCGQEYLTNSRKSIYCSQVCQMRKWREDEEKKQSDETERIKKLEESNKLAWDILNKEAPEDRNRPLTRLEYDYISLSYNHEQQTKELEKLKADTDKKIEELKEIINKQKELIKKMREKK